MIDVIFWSILINIVQAWIIVYTIRRNAELRAALNDIKNIANRFSRKEKPKIQIPSRNQRTPSNPKIW